MVSKEAIVNNESGLHARPAALFVQRANSFESDIYVELDGKRADAKSIIGVMSLGAYSGEKVRLVVEGSDELEAIKSLKNLLEKEMVGM